MFEIRKKDFETGKLMKCWFQIKSYEEALKVIIDHCFDGKHWKDENIDHWYDDRYELWGVWNDKMKFVLDDAWGPSTIWAFDIKQV